MIFVVAIFVFITYLSVCSIIMARLWLFVRGLAIRVLELLILSLILRLSCAGFLKGVMLYTRGHWFDKLLIYGLVRFLLCGTYLYWKLIIPLMFSSSMIFIWPIRMDKVFNAISDFASLIGLVGRSVVSLASRSF